MGISSKFETIYPWTGYPANLKPFIPKRGDIQQIWNRLSLNVGISSKFETIYLNMGISSKFETIYVNGISSKFETIYP